MTVTLQQVVGDFSGRVPEMGLGHPLVGGFVGEDVQRAGEGGIRRIEAERRLRVARDGRHVDVALEATRAPECGPVVDDRQADPANVVADQVVKGQSLRRLEFKVREDDEEVVEVPVGLVEAPSNGDPRRIIGRDAIGFGGVVVRAVVLDDRDGADVPGDARSGVGKGSEPARELPKATRPVDGIEPIRRGRGGREHEGREASHGQGEGGGRAHPACPAAVYQVRNLPRRAVNASRPLAGLKVRRPGPGSQSG